MLQAINFIGNLSKCKTSTAKTHATQSRTQLILIDRRSKKKEEMLQKKRERETGDVEIFAQMVFMIIVTEMMVLLSSCVRVQDAVDWPK